jgi:hypothetical protein
MEPEPIEPLVPVLPEPMPIVPIESLVSLFIVWSSRVVKKIASGAGEPHPL